MSREYVLQPFRRTVELKIDYAAELNPQQHAAVTALPVRQQVHVVTRSRQVRSHLSDEDLRALRRRERARGNERDLSWPLRRRRPLHRGRGADHGR